MKGAGFQACPGASRQAGLVLVHHTCVGLTCLPVLLHTVAAVVELGEGGGELVQVVTQRVEQQVVQDLLQDLREPQDALPQLPLLLVVQKDLGGLCCPLQRGLVEAGETSDGPDEVRVHRSQRSTSNTVLTD